MKKKSLFTYVGILLFVVAAGGVFYKKVYLPKTTYQSVTAVKKSFSKEVYGIGNVGANHIYAVTAQTGGKIVAIHTDAGRWVKEGELLIEIDDVDLPQLIESAKLAVKKATLEFEAAQKSLDTLLAQKALAQITYRRYARLKKDSFASQVEFDKARTDLKVIESQIAATRARVASAKVEIARASKALEALETKRTRYRITAPRDGYVIARLADIAQSILPAQPILKIVDPESVWIRTYIDEKLCGDLKAGQSAKILLRSHPDRPYDAVVARISPQSDPVTKEREIDVAFKKVPIPFYINEQAEVTIKVAEYTDIVTIAARALIFSQNGVGVWRYEDGKAHFVPVRIVARTGSEAAVKGIDAGVKLLIPDVSKRPLKEGASVHI